MKALIKKLIQKSIPFKIKKLIVPHAQQCVYLENGFARLTYSQQGEDLELCRLFSGLKNGFYIDVGAFHPIKYSNTYKLYQEGWRGINIEPNPEQVSLFNVHRPEDINLNIGISKEKCVLDYFSFNGGAVNTFVESHAKTWSREEGFVMNEIKKIQTQPLADVLEKYLPPNQKIDLLNVDVEGMDIEVLNSNDWRKFRPYAVLVEEIWQNKKTFEESEVYQFLVSNNYSLWNIIGITMFFTDNSVIRQKA
ncbi:MAG: FkbM family methyltransferase [Bacteroidetes bacterium]|nr:FkbM family methyltransferase [Bacteroidota bacterium]